MAAQANIGGALCENSLMPFLVAYRKVWLTSAAGVPCSDAANIGEHRFGHKVNFAPGRKMYIYSVPVQKTANIVQSLVDLR